MLSYFRNFEVLQCCLHSSENISLLLLRASLEENQWKRMEMEGRCPLHQAEAQVKLHAQRLSLPLQAVVETGSHRFPTTGTAFHAHCLPSCPAQDSAQGAGFWECTGLSLRVSWGRSVPRSHFSQSAPPGQASSTRTGFQYPPPLLSSILGVIFKKHIALKKNRGNQGSGGHIWGNADRKLLVNLLTHFWKGWTTQISKPRGLTWLSLSSKHKPRGASLKLMFICDFDINGSSLFKNFKVW